MKKKLLALLCAASIALSLTACSNEDTISSTSTANTASTESVTTSSDTDASENSAMSESSSEADSSAESVSNSEVANADISNGKFILSNKNATPEAKKVYDFICENVGNKIISGQQESTWIEDDPDYTNSEQYEFDYILDKTGKLPAIRGLDYMNDDFEGVNRRAKEWWDKGGIVTICWHCGCDFTMSYNEAMQTEIEDWDKALTEGTDEYNKLIAGMDRGAEALKELADQNIPVLWRPFHEMDGAWFWWGKGGADNFKKLWKLMYERYTGHWELNNLIWVCGMSKNIAAEDETQKTNPADWYPGDEYVDCVGADSYSAGSRIDLYNAVYNVVGNKKPIPYHECGRIPLPEELKTDGAKWAWFMTWHTTYATNGKSNPVERLQTIYNDDYVITLDELPEWNS